MVNVRICFFVFLGLFAQFVRAAEPLVKTIGSWHPQVEAQVRAVIGANYDLSQFREVRMHMVLAHGSRHALIYLISKKYHRFDLAMVEINLHNEAEAFHRDYKLQSEDIPLTAKPHCPDLETEFISFAPNDDAFEQQTATRVAAYAEAYGFKTVRLFLQHATRQNYLNYMSCPKLKGNFYDGDSDPEAFITVDSEIRAWDMRHYLNGAFRFHVTNIWLACEAFNDPMLSSVVNAAQTQKYAAGVNDLLVGPSDRTAECAMKAAIEGQPLTAAFQACVKEYDSTQDHWGFAGRGADYFGY